MINDLSMSTSISVHEFNSVTVRFVAPVQEWRLKKNTTYAIRRSSTVCCHQNWIDTVQYHGVEEVFGNG